MHSLQYDVLNNLACRILPIFSIILVFSHAITLWDSISTYVYVVVIDSYGFDIRIVIRMYNKAPLVKKKSILRGRKINNDNPVKPKCIHGWANRDYNSIEKLLMG